MDLLSTTLRRIRLRGDQVTAHAIGERATYDRGERVVHLPVRGSVLVQQAGQDDLLLEPGTAVLLPRGEPHRVRSRSGEPGGDDGAGDVAWLTGHYTLDEAHPSPLVSALPGRIVLGREGRTEWLEVSARQLLAELRAPSPGSWLMASRILDLLFVHALRHDARTGERPGWLVGALDPHLGPVVDALHRDPTRRWTVAQMAQLGRMSRSVLSDRFTRALGTSPGAYVARLRLDAAAELLRDGGLPVGSVARRSGYSSEAAFARAFRRQHGVTPSAWRDGEQDATPEEVFG